MEISLQITILALVRAIISMDKIVVGFTAKAIGIGSGFDQSTSFFAQKKLQALALLQVWPLGAAKDVFDFLNVLDRGLGKVPAHTLNPGMGLKFFFDKNALK